MQPQPDYIPIPHAIARSKHADLVGHYCGLRSLAWRNDFTHTDPMPAVQLWEFLGLKKSRFYGVIGRLEGLDWIRRNVPYPGGLQILFPVVCLVESDISDLVVVKLNKKELPIGEKTNLTLTDLSPINRTTVQYIGQDEIKETLQGLGVHRVLADELSKTQPAEKVFRAIEIYQWARKNDIAKTPGYLVRFVQQGWEAPEGFIPPGHLCKSCGKSRDNHGQGCPELLSFWEDEQAQNIDDICPTCGQYQGHAPDCWRMKIIK